MEIIDDELVEIDLNDYSSEDDENQYQFDNNGLVSNNEEYLIHNIEIPLVENSIISEIKDDKDIYDKYGFKKIYKYISKKRQEEYEIYYQRILERREQKWNLLLEECGGEFPSMSSKLKRFIRKGIPGYIRSLCWFYYSGAKEEMEKNKGLYVELLKYEYIERGKGLTKKDSKSLDCIFAVEKDLFRTFPDNKYFAVDESVLTMDSDDERVPNKKFYINPYIGSLRNILVAFVYYSLPKSDNGYGGTSYTIGYCQSLNYIAGLLLLIFSQNNDKLFKTNTAIEEMCFWVFVTLIDKILPREMYGENGMEGAIIEQELLWNLIIDENGRKFGVKKVAKWKKDMEKKNNIMNGIDEVPDSQNLTKLGILTFKWMTTCFVGVLPIETVLRVWDCIFTEGYITIIRVTLTLLRIYENDISKNDDELEGWDFINNLPYKIIDCHRFMEICFRPRYSINPLKNLYYSITLVNPITNQLELKKNFENGDSSKQTANPEIGNAQLQHQQEQQQQQHEIQHQHQQQLYQVIQNQHLPCRKHSHQRNKSFSSFLSIKYKNQPQQNIFNNNENKNKTNMPQIVENKIRHSKSSITNTNLNSNDGSIHSSSDNIKSIEKREESFSSKKHKNRNHTKSYSENPSKNNKYNYDSVNYNNNLEGSFYNKISTALKNRKLVNSKKLSIQKDSLKNSNTELPGKKNSSKKSISNFDILKKQLENLGNTERYKKSFIKYNNFKNKSSRDTLNSINSINVASSDNQAIKNNNNKSYYNTLNESINNSIDINNNTNELYSNESNSEINSKKELYSVNHYSQSQFNDNVNNSDYLNESSDSFEDCEQSSIMEDTSNNQNDQNGNLIIVKPLYQINTKTNNVNNSMSSSHLNIVSSPQVLSSNENDIFCSSEDSIKEASNTNINLRNRVLKYKNKKGKEKTDIQSMFNNSLTLSTSNSISNNLSSNEDIDLSSNEQVILLDDSITKLGSSENIIKETTSNNDINNVFNNKNNILSNHSHNEIRYSPPLSMVSQSSVSTQSSDLTCSSISYSGSEDEDEDDEEQFFFSINELTGTINGDLIKLNEENSIPLSNNGDSCSIISSDPKKSSFVSFNNDILIKTIEEKLKEKIIDKQQNFKYLDILNGSKIGQSHLNHTKHKKNALSCQYDNFMIKDDIPQENKYYSLNNLSRKYHSLSLSLSSMSSSKDDKDCSNNSTNKLKKSHHTFNDFQQIDSNDEFKSFVNIYYQYDDNNINEIKNPNIENKNNLLSPSKNNCNKKMTNKLDPNDIVIGQKNKGIRAKGPDFRIYCSNEIIPSISSSPTNNNGNLFSQEDNKLGNEEKLNNLSESALLDYKNKQSGSFNSINSSSIVSSSNELNKPIIILSSEIINESCSTGESRRSSYVKYYLTPDVSTTYIKDEDIPSLNKNNGKLVGSNNNINESENNDKENISTNCIKNDELEDNTNDVSLNNQCNISNNNDKSGSNSNEDNKLSSSSNNDLIEQMQVFWRVTFPKNEGYHLVLRKGGIGNLSNKIISKYRKKLWEKRNKEKMKNNV